MDKKKKIAIIKTKALPVFDIVIYIIISVLVLFKRPSFNINTSVRTIILQTIVGGIALGCCRGIFGIYRKKPTLDEASKYVRLILADVMGLAAYYIAQFLLSSGERIELLTISLIVILSIFSGVIIRWIIYMIDKKSIDLTDVIPFSPPDISELEIKEVERALRSGWITTGPRVKTLEKQIKDYVGSAGCACLSSNTACSEMALRILGVGADDEVITCAYTYTASASVVIHAGAKLVLVDCSERDGSIEMNYDALEDAITPNTKVIIPVDLAGIPCDYERIFEIVNRKKDLFTPNNEIQKAIGRIIVLADGAHAFGAKYHGKMIGSVADFTSFSFHAVKNFTTGEGGALTWNHIEGIEDEYIYKQIQLYSLHGQSKDAFAKSQKGSWEYDIIGPWYKCNMTDIAAAIGLAQFERYPVLLKRRKEIIEKYDEELSKIGVKFLEHYSKDYVGSGHLYITRIPGISPEKRNEIITKMAEKNVSCNVHYKPLPMMTAYKNLGFDIKNYPNAYDKFANEITLPLYSTLTDQNVETIISTFIETVKEHI